ncbi:MAG: 50S ribosome-binding GTPase [Parcubacteria group bacterium]|nr:50S ribosome-binding GTPase [Parcubacteria group bacterium]
MTELEKNNNPLPLVVIFGRANVGKSTLFNCLTEKRQALVSDIAGTTRDSNLGRVDWLGHDFEIVDTGGIIDLKRLAEKTVATGDIADQVQRQASQYLKQADLVVFLVDNKTGLLPQDKEMALLIKGVKVK